LTDVVCPGVRGIRISLGLSADESTWMAVQLTFPTMWCAHSLFVPDEGTEATPVTVAQAALHPTVVGMGPSVVVVVGGTKADMSYTFALQKPPHVVDELPTHAEVQFESATLLEMSGTADPHQHCVISHRSPLHPCDWSYLIAGLKTDV
jgi:hypothetical protein